MHLWLKLLVFLCVAKPWLTTYLNFVSCSCICLAFSLPGKIYCISYRNASTALAEICEVTDFIAKAISTFKAADHEKFVINNYCTACWLTGSCHCLKIFTRNCTWFTNQRRNWKRFLNKSWISFMFCFDFFYLY